jgi:hypothetical protein
MLRILLDDLKPQRVVLILHGRTVEKLAGVLERGCAELSRSGLAVVILLSGVAFIGLQGVEVLRRLARSGVGIMGNSPLVADAFEPEWIEVDQAIGGADSGKVSGQDGDENDPSD